MRRCSQGRGRGRLTIAEARKEGKVARRLVANTNFNLREVSPD